MGTAARQLGMAFLCKRLILRGLSLIIYLIQKLSPVSVLG
jgi:hypothetical protein